MSLSAVPAFDDARLEIAVDTLKTLAMDAVQRANSGHPGMPMGAADCAAVLWTQFLTTDPAAPRFPDRDRFVLSAGHGSMLLYGLLHLAGFDLPLEEILRFRQLHSKTPGHPEHGLTEGVETTTGPLGQGFANGVGMAMAADYLAAYFDRPGFSLLGHRIFAICSDGDLMEGISHEAASLAGHLGLGRLVYLYDDNRISIDGSTDLTYTTDVTARFEAYGWHVLDVDGHDRPAVAAALAAGIAQEERPTLIRCRTHIGHGSPHKQDSAASHGSPLGVEEIRLTKEGMGWDPDAHFLVPEEARAAFEGLQKRGRVRRATWETTMGRYRAEHPELAALWDRVHTGDGLPEDLEARVPTFTGDKAQATRAASGKVIAALAEALPQLWGGSADLAGSNKTLVAGEPPFSRADKGGRNLHYGVREHAMGAIMNGMALSTPIIPYGGTFLTFSDYFRPSIRLAALMEQRAIYVLSHDSIFLGEDGPTHQSVEHAMALRQIPGLHVLRPADARETAASWLAALRRTSGPTALLLTRQGVPALDGTRGGRAIEGVERGAYVVHETAGEGLPDLILLGTGSELHLCTHAAPILEADGHRVRVVSVPSLERFRSQEQAYRETILPAACPLRVSVEAGRTSGWEPLVGPLGASIGIDRFGLSAPAEELAVFFGLTVDNVVGTARDLFDGFAAASEAAIAALEEARARLDEAGS